MFSIYNLLIVFWSISPSIIFDLEIQGLRNVNKSDLTIQLLIDVAGRRSSICRMQKEICFVETFLGEEPGPAFFVLLRLPQVLSHFFIARGVLAACWASEGTEQLPETH